jgi:hypothetical protein
MKVDASSIHLEAPLNPSVSCTHRRRALFYYYIFVSSRAATNLGSPALYYYIFVSWRAAMNLGSPASWGRLVACGRLSIGQMPLTSTTPRLRLAATRGKLSDLRPIGNRPGGLRTTASRRVSNPPQDAILPHVRRAIPLSCRTPVL